MQRKEIGGMACLVLTAMIWGFAFVSQVQGMASMSPLFFGATRFTLGALSLIPLLWFRRRGIAEQERRRRESNECPTVTLGNGITVAMPKCLGNPVVVSVICGIVLFTASTVQQYGILYSGSAGRSGFITALYIVLVPVFSTVLGKKAKKSIWLCVIAAVAGLYFLCFDGSSTLSFSSGDMYVFLSAFAFTAQILAVDYFVQQVDGIALSCAQFAVVIMLSAIGALAFGEHTTLEAVKTCIPYLLYVGVVSSGVGYTLQIIAQKDGDPTVVSLLLSLESFFAVVCGAIVLHERMSLREYFGCALMLAAVILSQLPEKSAKAVESGKKE